jgi:hypothetical protein
MKLEHKRKKPAIDERLLFKNVVCDMPPLPNLPPFDDNEIVRWFAHRYNVTLKEGQHLFDRARIASSRSPIPFLIYDRDQKLWHGINVKVVSK